MISTNLKQRLYNKNNLSQQKQCPKQKQAKTKPLPFRVHVVNMNYILVLMQVAHPQILAFLLTQASVIS